MKPTVFNSQDFILDLTEGWQPEDSIKKTQYEETSFSLCTRNKTSLLSFRLDGVSVVITRPLHNFRTVKKKRDYVVQ